MLFVNGALGVEGYSEPIYIFKKRTRSGLNFFPQISIQILYSLGEVRDTNCRLQSRPSFCGQIFLSSIHFILSQVMPV